MRTMALLVGLLALTAAPRAEAPDRPTPNRRPLEVQNHATCPVQILQRRSRVSGALDLDPWAAFRGPEDRTPGDREIGPGEYQLVFDVAFRNAGAQPVTGVAFLWEAFDDSGRSIYRRVGTFADRLLPSGTARLGHEVDLDPAQGRGRYRLSVYRVQLADGTTWSPPAPDGDDTP